tara:strand:+ start:271 stop:696 length:426 start_codon:yes stop_codon:yes gene_type:complete
MNKYINTLPDDIIEKIYSKIYYPQNYILLSEIKLVYYITTQLVNNYGLYNVCCCAITHDEYYMNIEAISLQYIEDTHDKINNLTYLKTKNLLNRIIGKMSLEKKYSFIFYMTDRTIRQSLYDTNNYIKYIINNIINNNLNR